MQQVIDQLKWHIKDRDRKRAIDSGRQPWFETFRRLAGEYACVFGNFSAEDLLCKEKLMLYEEVKSLKRRHDRAKPRNYSYSPILFSDGTKCCVIDGNNRVNQFLQEGNKGQQLKVIVVSKVCPR